MERIMVLTDAKAETATPTPADASTSPSSPAPVETVAADADAAAPAASEPAANTTAPAAEGEGQPAPEAADYDSLALPKGSTFDDAYLTNLKALAEANGLSAETAQALIDRDHAAATEAEEAQREAWGKQVADWEAQVRADKTLGGDHLATTVSNAKAAFARFGPPGFAEEVNNSGFGNHPGLLAFASAVGAALGESTTAVNGDPAPVQSGPDLRRIFSNSAEMFERARR